MSEFYEARLAEIQSGLDPKAIPANTGNDEAAAMFRPKSAESQAAANQPETPGESEKFASMFRPQKSEASSKLAEKIGIASDTAKSADFQKMVERFGESRALHFFSLGYDFKESLLVEVARLRSEVERLQADRDDKAGALEVMELRQQLRKPSEPEQPKAEALFRRSASRRQYQVSVS